MNLKSACFLLSLLHAGSVAALGLGELSVRSHLGQALHVTVKILGAGPATTAECFSLAPSENAAVSPPRPQLKLEQGGSQTLLHIRTAYAINDPIAQFALIADCESRLRRDYVVLLDPPDLVTPALSRDLPEISVVEKPVRAAPVSPPARTTSQPKVKHAPVAPRPANASKTTASPPRQPQLDDYQAPRLVLSGRHGASSGALSLRVDTNLPDLNRPHTDNLTPDELSDENTALTRKLAHLEAQLLALQKRNAEIESRRVESPTAKLPSVQAAQWPLYLLLIGLLAAAALLIVWLRRRGQGTSAAARVSSEPMLSEIDRMTSDSWSNTTPARRSPRQPEHQPEAEAEAEIERKESLAESERIIEFIPSSLADTTEVNDDILDQAEVYMAHGHGDLAIHLLQEHLRAAPDESPVPWLLLLDLLHREGDTEGYAVASAECRRHFNVNLSGHPVSQDTENSHGLEDYPHLLEQLTAVWGTPNIEDFFLDLIYDKRGGTRVGFEPAAYRDILLLRAVSRDVQPLAA